MEKCDGGDDEKREFEKRHLYAEEARERRMIKSLEEVGEYELADIYRKALREKLEKKS